MGYGGDHAVYVSGQTMHGTAVLSVSPALAQDLTGVYVQGAAGNAGTFTASNVTIPAGQTSFSASVADGTAFPASQTQFLDPMNVNWSVAQTGTSCNNGCVDVGMSANPVYVTLADRILPAGQAVMLTYVALAVGNGGAMNQSAAFAGTWARFSSFGNGPANVTTWNGTTLLAYYPQGVGFQSCATNPVQLLTVYNQNGQCGSFALLFQFALDMNGISTSYVSVLTADGDGMVVKDWSWPSDPTQPSTLPYGWMLVLENEPGFFGMVPLPDPPQFGDLLSLSGIPAQNSGTPSEKFFGSHYIVKIDPSLAPAGQPGPYFDPSYGVWYVDNADFEAKAIAGYAKNGFLNDPRNVFRFRLKVPGTVNIMLNP